MKQCHHRIECRRSNFRQLPLLEELRLQLATLGMSSVKVVLLHPTLPTEVAAGVAELEVLSMWNNQQLSGPRKREQSSQAMLLLAVAYPYGSARR